MASPRGTSTGSSERGFIDDPSVFIPEPGQTGIPSVRAASKLLRWLVNEQDDEGNWTSVAPRVVEREVIKVTGSAGGSRVPFDKS